MFNRVTADGFFSGPNGVFDWAVPDPEIERESASHTPNFDTVLFGRRTYDMFESFWPHALDDSPTTAEDPHAPGHRSPETRAFAVALNEMTKYVFSTTRKEVTWKNSRLVHDLDPREIEAMKKQPGKDMLIFGSGSIVSKLTQHGLIDEYQFVVTPLVLGSGRQLFSGLPKGVKLKLLGAKEYPSGNVMLRYAAAK
jgi:dihydrofolate reductase